jgi:hypothetical protein
VQLAHDVLQRLTEAQGRFTSRESPEIDHLQQTPVFVAQVGKHRVGLMRPTVDGVSRRNGRRRIHLQAAHSRDASERQ